LFDECRAKVFSPLLFARRVLRMEIGDPCIKLSLSGVALDVVTNSVLSRAERLLFAWPRGDLVREEEGGGQTHNVRLVTASVESHVPREVQHTLVEA
jgi:hypothetical protein